MTPIYDPKLEIPEAVSDFIEKLALHPNARLAKPVEEQSIDDIMAIHAARKEAVSSARLLRLALPKGTSFPEADFIRDLAALALTEDQKSDRSAEKVEEIEAEMSDDALLNDCAEFREMEGRAYAVYRGRALSNMHAYPCRKLNRGIDDLSNDDLFSIYSELREVVEIARQLKAAADEDSSGPEADLVAFMAAQWIAADATEEELEDYDGDVEEFENDIDEDRLFDAHGALEAIEARLATLHAPIVTPSI